MPSVTYLGPVDPHVPTTRYRLPGEDADEADVVLSKGIEVPDVTAAQAKRLREDGEHMFSIDGKKTSSAKKSG